MEKAGIKKSRTSRKSTGIVAKKNAKPVGKSKSAKPTAEKPAVKKVKKETVVKVKLTRKTTTKLVKKQQANGTKTTIKISKTEEAKEFVGVFYTKYGDMMSKLAFE